MLEREGRTTDTASARPPKDGGLRIVASDANHRIAIFGPVVLSVWIQETTTPALGAMARHIESLAPGAPGGRVGLVVVVEPDAVIPPSEVRAELSRIRRSAPLAMTALVYEGTGFGAALVRGVTTSLNLLERRHTRTHIFADVKAAAEWIAETSPAHGGGAALEAAVRSLRSAQPAT